jgi:hypothetical protein
VKDGLDADLEPLEYRGDDCFPDGGDAPVACLDHDGQTPRAAPSAKQSCLGASRYANRLGE